MVAGLYGAGWAAFFLLGDRWYQLAVAAYLALVFAQVGFLGHDIGHRQVFGSRRWNNLVGLACADLATGISYGYWVDKHNRHHSRPNEVGADPDVGPGVISWTADQVRTKTGLGRLVARHQAALFFPLACLEAVSLHVSSARALGTKPVRHTPTEAILLVAHAAVYLGAVFVVLSPLRAVAFIAVQQGIFGLYLGCAFAPNHKGMPMPAPGEKLDFVHRQVTTARNVRGGRASTWPWAASTTRSSTICSRPCLWPTSAAAKGWSGRTARPTGSTTARRPWCAPTPPPCGISAMSGGWPAANRCVPSAGCRSRARGHAASRRGPRQHRPA